MAQREGLQEHAKVRDWCAAHHSRSPGGSVRELESQSREIVPGWVKPGLQGLRELSVTGLAATFAAVLQAS